MTTGNTTGKTPANSTEEPAGTSRPGISKGYGIPTPGAGLLLRLTLTRISLVFEQIQRAFWLLATYAGFGFTLLATGIVTRLPDGFARSLYWLGLVFLVGAFVFGVRVFRWPDGAETRAALDRSLPERPLAALADRPLSGAEDPETRAIWEAHLKRMRAGVSALRIPSPAPGLNARDPFGLRFLALLGVGVVLVFGQAPRTSDVVALLPAGAGNSAVALGPRWEGWLEPPAYTGLPSLYLNDLTEDSFPAPKGSRMTFRFYGETGSVELTETVSGADVQTHQETRGEGAGTAIFTLDVSGKIEIQAKDGGDKSVSWDVRVLRDRVPEVALIGRPEVEASGLMAQEFQMRDDYGVVSGTAVFTLNMAAIDRQFGLAVAPEPRADLVLDLPMTIAGDRRDFTEEIVENLSEHPWAGLPVFLTLTATDASGNRGISDPVNMLMPGRRFFDTRARAMIEMRRDLLWARSNGARVAQVIRAVSHRPERLFQDSASYLMLRQALRRLETGLDAGLDAGGAIDAALQEELAAVLWEVAVLFEDGSLSDALERMRQAQERLEQAMRDGASDEEIQQLMDALRDATEDYMNQLAQNPEGTTDQPNAGETPQVTQQDIDQMMDRIQELMEQGRMAEAQELLDELQQMMENMRVTEGGEGGPQAPGEEAMEELGDTLREQQGLSDQAFRDLQEQFNPDAQAGESQGNEGRSGGQGRGQQHTPQGGGQPGEGQSEGGTGQGGSDRIGEGQSGGGQGAPGDQDQGGGQGEDDTGASGQGESLADRQQALRDELARQEGNLPGGRAAEGEAARRALEEAGRAMDRAEDDLRAGDLPGAIENQADAMEALREGMRQLGEAMAQNDEGQSGEQGEAGSDTRNGRLDPLGRNTNSSAGNPGTGDNLLQGPNANRRARELQEDLRERSADETRPAPERDYFRRLLDRF